MHNAFFKDNPSWMQEHDFDANVLDVMRRIPRHEFVPKSKKQAAYENHPISIGHGQTISQPLIVAFMTSALKLKPENKVLEIGTGSGYQAAILSKLVSQVYSLEIIPKLYESAKQRLSALGYDNIQLKCADGHEGWEQHAPFDAIMVTAATQEPPLTLIKQLKKGANMIIPIGRQRETQYLMHIHKDNMQGTIISQYLLPVSFVPLTSHQ